MNRRAYFYLLLLFVFTGFSGRQVYVPQQESGQSCTGSKGLVTTAHPLASQAGIEMLEAGGNAVDAAVAAAFAIGVVEPDGSGIGGGGGMIIHLAKENKDICINYYPAASENVDELDFGSGGDRKSASAILVPGTVAGLTEALKRYGKLPLAKVLEPAIRYAKEGFEVDGVLGSIILDNVSLLQKYSSTASVYLPEGFPVMQGEKLVQRALGETLDKIAGNGKDAFYSGALAETMVKDVTEAGGKLTLNDLKNYEPVVSEPVRSMYRGYEIVSCGVPLSGTSVVEALNILENADLAKMGPPASNGETLHLMAETMRRVYSDRSSFMGDPRFSEVPVEGLLSDSYARTRFRNIDQKKAEPRDYRKTESGNPFSFSYDQKTVVPGKETDTDIIENDEEDNDGLSAPSNRKTEVIDKWGRVVKPKNTKPAVAPKKKSEKPVNNEDDKDNKEFDGHTTHLCTIDSEGNMVSLTQTLGTFFGSGFTSNGVLFNSAMANFSTTGSINTPVGGKQPRSSISPTIILKNGEPFMVVGSPGATRIIATVVQVIVNVIDFNMSIEQANDAPRFFCQKFDDYLHLEGGFPENVKETLKQKGHNLRVHGDYDLFFGGVQLIGIDWKNHKFTGAADKRRGGNAVCLN